MAKNFDQRICFFDTRFVCILAASKSCRCENSRHSFPSNTEGKKYIVVYRSKFEVVLVRSSSTFGSWTISLNAVKFSYEKSLSQNLLFIIVLHLIFPSFYSNFFAFTVHVRVVYDQ